MVNRKNIYVAYTGGTIGMKKSQEGYVPDKGHLTSSINALPEFHREEMPYFTINEYQPLIDSSNMTPADWQRIADDIKAHYDDYDGFVVLHGTDTMAFTSSALSFMFENLSKPIIVTGSQIPLSQLRSDGQVNVLNALYVAANYPITEVGLFFNNRLYRGNRSIKAYADGFDAFDSPNMPPLLEAGININLLSGVVKGEVTSQKEKSVIVREITPQPIGVVHLYPGISADVIENVIRQPVKALILRSYGVGNAPQDTALLTCLNKAKQQGIIVVNCSQCIKGTVNMSGYATGNALSQAGVISGHDMTLEATLTKLHYLLSQHLGYEEVCKLMQLSLRGELTNHEK
ncbi:MAG: asparaginase [Litorilituus sp.]|jgi:L-asparaginase|nr:asparaginase [Litorilituus sp.]